VLAERLIEEALAGDLRAFQIIFDRLERTAPARVLGAGEAAQPLKRIVVPPCRDDRSSQPERADANRENDQNDRLS
jgi:hypothetical protein